MESPEIGEAAGAEVLQIGPMPPHALDALRQRFRLLTEDVLVGGTPRPGIRGIATNGKTSVTSALLDLLPDLRIVSCLGAGTDGLDLQELSRRKVSVATTSRVLANDVADVAMGLTITLARDFSRAHRYVRDGRWEAEKYRLGHALAGARLGILGLGTIGGALAHRAAAFGMEIGYHNRSPRSDTATRYFDSLEELARWCRFLVICCPGGPATYHLVDDSVLEAIGPAGWVINVSRGSVLDERALVAALEAGAIAGAGLDVFEDEPRPLPALLERDDVILLPHIGSATEETRSAMAQAMVDALLRAI